MKNQNPSHEQLLAEIAELKSKLVKSTDLEANLLATNQQMKAGEQQLQATIQQLTATEQQLRAATEEAKEQSEFAINILSTVREPFLVLSQDLQVQYANRSFYKYFKVTEKETVDKYVYDLGNRQWNIPELRTLLEEILPEKSEINSYKVEHTFEDIGTKVMLLNVKEIYKKGSDDKLILFAVEDISAQKKYELELTEKIELLQASEQQLQASNQQLLAAEQQLRASNQQLLASEQQSNVLATKYKALFEGLNIAAFVHPYKNQGFNSFVEVNQMACKQLGYTKEELLKLSPREISAAKDVMEQGKPSTRDILATQGYEVFEATHLTKDGKEIPVEVNSRLFKYGDATMILSLARDITFQKQAEETIKKNQRRLVDTLENMNDAFVALDKNWRYTYMNKNAGQIFGRNPKEMIGRQIWSEFPEGIDQPFHLNYKKAMNENISINMEEYYPAYDRWFENRIIPTEDGISIFFTDTTERRKTEMELSEFFTAVNQSPALIGITNLNGDIEYMNPKMEEITGYTSSELKGKNFRILKSGVQPKEIYMELWSNITADKVWRGEFNNKKKNGELYWESALISPVFDKKGNKTRYIKIAEDITANKLRDEIQKIIHNITNAVVSSIDVNDFARFVKEELTKVIDTTNFYIALYNSDTNSFSMASHFDEKDSFNSFPADGTLTGYVLNTKKPLLATTKVQSMLESAGEIDLVGTPSKVWLGVPLLFNDKAIGVVAVQNYDDDTAFDESHISMLEIVSHQVSISIYRKTQEKELKAALELARESDRLKTAFLANMSHEIRTPMNGILGFTSLLEEGSFSDDDKAEFIKNIAQSGQRLLETVIDIVDISKIEAGQVEVKSESVDVKNLLNEVFSFFMPEASNRGLSLELVYPGSKTDEVIICDNYKLHGVLSNLVKNAIKFTKEGSIRLGYKIKAINEELVMEFFVEDTGIGIPANRQDAIFGRFVQADIEDSRVYEGSGLGLAISKAYVEMLGGTIGVDSQEGKGSRFYFTVPYITENNVASENIIKLEKSQNEKPSASNMNLLIVEDEEVSITYLKAVLRNIFKTTLCATNGLEAVELCKDHPEIDLILMDIKMPVMNGYKATREIRKFNNKVYIIAQTAFALLGDKEKALEAGCNDYISKPINKKNLLEKINALIEKNSS